MTELQTYNISLDTSFIEGQNFLNGSSIKELGRLSKKGTIKLFITDITYREVISRFTKNLITAEEKIKKPKREFDNHARVLRNFYEFRHIFELPEINTKKLLKEFRKNFDQWIVDSLIMIIPTETVTIKDVFNDYFKNKPPFHSTQKKNEFPDAFTIKAIENHFHNEKTYLLSHDNDLLEYKDDRIIPTTDHAQLIDLIIRESSKKTQEAIIELVDECFRREIPTLEKQILEIIEADIKDEIGGTLNFDYILVQSVNSVEITDICIDRYSVVHLDPELSKIESNVNFSFVASFSGINRRDGWYDPSTQIWNFPNAKDYIIEDTYDTTAIIKAKVDMKGKTVDFEIENINEQKSFNVFESFRAY